MKQYSHHTIKLKQNWTKDTYMYYIKIYLNKILSYIYIHINIIYCIRMTDNAQMVTIYKLYKRFVLAMLKQQEMI